MAKYINVNNFQIDSDLPGEFQFISKRKPYLDGVIFTAKVSEDDITKYSVSNAFLDEVNIECFTRDELFSGIKNGDYKVLA
jgi:hypothetical protein